MVVISILKSRAEYLNWATSIHLFICFLTLAAVTGCKDNRCVYNLDSTSFDEASLEMVGRHTGIAFPEGTKGIHLAYFGDGIDPLLFAKVEIQKSENLSFKQQLDNLPNRRGDIVVPAATKVDWWEAVSDDDVVLTRLFDRNRNGIHVKYCCENGRWYLYILWVKV